MKSLFEILAICVLLLIVFIMFVPYLSDLQTVNRGNDIVDTAKDGDIEKATQDWGDLVVETSEGAIWSVLLAPLIGLILGGLTALFLYLKRQ